MTNKQEQINQDMEKAKDEYAKCFELMLERNSKYGDSWKVLSIPSIANLCEMKLHRIANMKEDNLNPKIIDELQDTCNYMIFAILKFRELNKIKNPYHEKTNLAKRKAKK